ncbi:hypothetical protein HDE_05367 [Halotydeus destructor]|nr:hypothetical protein HDE_05367 [Halotydeus destructor]
MVSKDSVLLAYFTVNALYWPTVAHPLWYQGKPVTSGPPPSASMGLLYVFSEASKRIPITELPQRLENMADDFSTSFDSWSGQAAKKAEDTILTVGNHLVDLFNDATDNMSEKVGQIITHSVDSVTDSFKDYLRDWIGCKSG